MLLLDRWLPDETLQAIGAENMFADTAFVVPDATGEAGEVEQRQEVVVARHGEAGTLIGAALLHGAAPLVGSGRRTPDAGWWGDTRLGVAAGRYPAAALLPNLPVQLLTLRAGERDALFG